MKDTTEKIGIKTQSLEPALSQDEQKEVIKGLAERLLRELPLARVIVGTVGIARDVEKLPPDKDSYYVRTRPGKRLCIDLHVTLERL